MHNYNYTGKIIYVGIDVHKKTFACVSICEGQKYYLPMLLAKKDISQLLSYFLLSVASAHVAAGEGSGFKIISENTEMTPRIKGWIVKKITTLLIKMLLKLCLLLMMQILL